MRINNTSIQGFFVYNPNAIFEKGDFIVYGKSIYLCTPVDSDSITGETPSVTSSNYKIYLGDQMTSISDYMNFVDNGGGEDKYISLSYLPAILNLYMQGFTGKGIIGNSITYSSPTSYEVILNGEDNTTKFTNYNNVLASLLIDKDINNGIFRISRKLPEVQIWLTNNIDYPSATQLDLESCILKQYTYLDVNGNKVRVQEIIDHLDGQIYYRSAYITQSLSTITGSGFKCATVNSKSLKDKANNLFSIYSSKLRYLESLSSDLRTNFRFKKVDLLNKTSYIILQNSDNTASNYVKCDNLSTIGNITVSIMTPKVNEMTGLYDNFEVSFDILDSITKYNINDTIYLEITPNILEGETTGTITLEIKNKLGGVVSGSFINSVFYQEYYS